jgi:xylitol oxidase
VRQTVYTDLPFAVIEAAFDAVFDAGTSVSVFTDWRGDTAKAVWVKDRVSDAEAMSAPRSDLFNAPLARQMMHPLPDGDAQDCTQQMGLPGPWHERLPHFRMGFAPSHGAEIQAEYFVPRDTAPRAVAALRRHGDRLAPLLMTAEIRTVAADTLWLSPGINGPYVGLHFTFRRDADGVRSVLPAIEADLGPLGAVPHWGKVTTMTPATIRARTPQLARFRDLALAFDPAGKFQNPYLRRLVFDIL